MHSSKGDSLQELNEVGTLQLASRWLPFIDNGAIILVYVRRFHISESFRWSILCSEMFAI